jgi:DNA-binding NtrC family response regulator
MVSRREGIKKMIVYIYTKAPYATNELRQIAMGILEDQETVDELVSRVEEAIEKRKKKEARKKHRESSKENRPEIPPALTPAVTERSVRPKARVIEPNDSAVEAQKPK